MTNEGDLTTIKKNQENPGILGRSENSRNSRKTRTIQENQEKQGF